MNARQVRTFQLLRRHDPSGVSGTGCVAVGVEFPDGAVALRWCSDRPTTTLFASLDDVVAIHGHGGATVVCWDDQERDLVAAAIAQAAVERPRPSMANRYAGYIAPVVGLLVVLVSSVWTGA